VRHPDYGGGRCRTDDSRRPNELIECKFPLAPRDSEARKRAAHGTVLDGHGKPVVGAIVHCPHVRTPGEGLINAGSIGDAITDIHGNFALYMPAGKSYRGLQERGDLVPPGSRYNLSITAPERDDCFPVDDMFANGASLEIRMPLATRRHEFRFENIDGPAKLNSVTIEYYPKVIPGKYMAYSFQDGGIVYYLPLHVTADSPDTLTFRLPAATVYRGRAVHCITGKSLPRVWATAAYGRNNLAELSDEDWRQLRDMPDVAGPNDHAAKSSALTAAMAP
jgi:hypothetical protein